MFPWIQKTPSYPFQSKRASSFGQFRLVYVPYENNNAVDRKGKPSKKESLSWIDHFLFLWTTARRNEYNRKNPSFTRSGLSVRGNTFQMPVFSISLSLIVLFTIREPSANENSFWMKNDWYQIWNKYIFNCLIINKKEYIQISDKNRRMLALVSDIDFFCVNDYVNAYYSLLIHWVPGWSSQEETSWLLILRPSHYLW